VFRVARREKPEDAVNTTSLAFSACSMIFLGAASETAPGDRLSTALDVSGIGESRRQY
jgi:purine-cytosine permease-like protein